MIGRKIKKLVAKTFLVGALLVALLSAMIVIGCTDNTGPEGGRNGDRTTAGQSVSEGGAANPGVSTAAESKAANPAERELKASARAAPVARVRAARVPKAPAAAKRPAPICWRRMRPSTWFAPAPGSS